MMKTPLGVAPSWAASDATWGILADDLQVRSAMVRVGARPDESTLYGRNDQGEQTQAFISETSRDQPVLVPAGGRRNTPDNLVANLRRRIRNRSAELDRDVHAYRALTGADTDDDVWATHSVRSRGQPTPRRVQRALENHAPVYGSGHPAIQSMRATLDYLQGKGPGPRPELVELVKQRGGPVYARWYRLDGRTARRQARIYNPKHNQGFKGHNFTDIEPGDESSNPRETRRRRGRIPRGGRAGCASKGGRTGEADH
jgi:hypothetical protein